MIEPEIRQFEASDGYRLHYRHWQPSQEKPSGYVIALHGIQSHSGWYDFSSRRLCEAGHDVRFIDRRGAGLNQPSRGDAAHEQRLVNDVVQFLGEVRHQRNQQAPTSPVVLLAVSWSGKLAAVIAGKRPELIDAVALLYPGICAKIGPTPFQRLQLALAKKLGILQKLVPVPLDDATLFTGETKWQKFIREDSLALKHVTVSFLLADRELSRLARRAHGRIRCPVLLMLAGKDRIIDNAATKQYYERLASTQRTLIEYPEAQHTLEFEPDRDQFVSGLLDWLNAVRPLC